MFINIPVLDGSDGGISRPARSMTCWAMDLSVERVESVCGKLGAGGGVGGATGAGDGALLTDDGGDDDSAVELFISGTGVDEWGWSECAVLFVRTPFSVTCPAVRENIILIEAERTGLDRNLIWCSVFSPRKTHVVHPTKWQEFGIK